MKRLIIKYGFLTVAVGTILIVLVIYLEHCLKHHYGSLDNIPTSFALGLKFGDHLGIAFLSIGIIGLFLELPEWRKHFHEEIETTINHVDYLKRLKDEELKQQQIVILRAIFKDIEIDKEGSFLNFYFTKIQQYIGSPYREGTKGVIVVNYSDDNRSFEVEETLSYTCRKFGDNIQKQVKWTTKPDEIDKIEDFKILVRIPEQLSKSPTFGKDYPEIEKPEMEFSVADPNTNAMLTPLEQGLGYVLSLDNYQGIDGLYVETHVKYVVPVDGAFTWTMPFPSKGLTVEISFPSDRKIYLEPFWIAPDDPDSSKYKPEEKPGSYTYSQPMLWLLPGDGVAFHFRQPRSDSGPSIDVEMEAAKPVAD